MEPFRIPAWQETTTFFLFVTHMYASAQSADKCKQLQANMYRPTKCSVFWL